MRHAFALLGVFAVVLLVYSGIAESPFLQSDAGPVVPGIASIDVADPSEADGDAEAECAVLAHLEETMGHTFGDGSRMEITRIEGRTLFGVVLFSRVVDGRKTGGLLAHRAVIRAAPASGKVTLEMWTGMGLGPSGPADFCLELPLSVFVPGL
jgi:hypothetical protein